MSLKDLLNEERTPRWTEEELETWIRELPEHRKQIVFDAFKKANVANAELHAFGCKLRARLEAVDARTAARNNAPWYHTVSEALIGWTIGRVITGEKKL